MAETAHIRTKGKTPKPCRAVQVPIDPCKIGAPFDSKAPAPVCDPWPPDRGARKTQQCQADGADPVRDASSRAGQQILVKINDSLHRKAHLEEHVAIHNYAAGYADHE